MAAAGFIIDSVYDRMRPCPAYPAAGLPTFRVRLFLDILTSDFHVSTTEMLFDGFLWRKSYGKRELFLTKKFRTSSGDTLVLNSVCVTTVRATPGGTPII